MKNWEMKDRTYLLKGGLSPLTYTLKSRGIYWFDEEKGYERELKHTKNQKTVFVDEFKGAARLDHITFEDGALFVPRNKQTLQKLLTLYHPDLNKVYRELDVVQDAVDELSDIEMEIDALILAKDLDVNQAEAILRVNKGNAVSTMTSKELRRDLLIFAKQSPGLFIELANDDNVELRNMGIRATEAGIIKLDADQRTFKWGKNGRKLMTVPFDENPYSALAAYFKTDDGVEVYKSIEKRLK
tara:strand:- start:1448 stop:2173 length:726 start_codon:yes stop_codon:yes gene_type:complete